MPKQLKCIIHSLPWRARPRSTLIALAPLLLPHFLPQSFAQTAQSGWVLEWSDEFDRSGSPVGSGSDWNYDGGNSMVREAKLQEENAFCQGGELIIEARKSGTGYTTAGLSSKKTYTQGRFRMRARLPYGKGMWPAFWLFGSTGKPYREIDIMEMIGGGNNDRTVYGTMHFDSAAAPGGLGHIGGTTALSIGKLADAYHTYGIDWDSTRIAWSFDETEYFSVPVQAPSRAMMRLPERILVNLAVGGSWPGSPDASTVFPQRYSIDWIRVYQKAAVPIYLGRSLSPQGRAWDGISTHALFDVRGRAKFHEAASPLLRRDPRYGMATRR